MFAEAAKGLKQSDYNVFIYVSMKLAGYKAAEAAGAELSSSTGAMNEAQALDALMDDAQAEDIGNLDSQDLSQEGRRLLELLGEVVFLSSKGITDRLVPQDSGSNNRLGGELNRSSTRHTGAARPSTERRVDERRSPWPYHAAQRFAPWIQYVNHDPQATIPSPADGEGSEGGPASWNALVEAIVNEPEFDGRLGRILYWIDTEIERAT